MKGLPEKVLFINILQIEIDGVQGIEVFCGERVLNTVAKKMLFYKSSA
jgi:hypothetical protein